MTAETHLLPFLHLEYPKRDSPMTCVWPRDTIVCPRIGYEDWISFYPMANNVLDHQLIVYHILYEQSLLHSYQFHLENHKQREQCVWHLCQGLITTSFNMIPFEVESIFLAFCVLATPPWRTSKQSSPTFLKAYLILLLEWMVAHVKSKRKNWL